MRNLLVATAVAVASGILYAASPLTALFGAATIVMCGAVVAGLDGRERIWVTRILAITIGARFLFVAGLLVVTKPHQEPFRTLFPDGAYLIERSWWLRNVWLGVPIGPHQSLQIVEPYGASSYPLLLAAIQYVVGPSPYGLALFSTTVYVAGVLLLYRIVRDRFGAAAATSGLALLLVWPSLFTWSVSVLKESFQFFLAAVVAASLYYIVRAHTWIARASWAAALAAAVSGLATLRSGTFEIAATAIALAIVFRGMAARRWIAIAAIVIAMAAVVVERDRLVDAVRLAANRHVGYVLSAGQGYELLEERYYAGNLSQADPMTFTECVRFLANAAVAFIVVPAPWNAASVSELVMVPQQICWYVCVIAALAGVAAGLRRDAWFTCIVAGSAVAGLIVIAPNSGNVGTLVRHRDMIVPFVLWLSVIGAVAVARAGLPLAAKGDTERAA